MARGRDAPGPSELLAVSIAVGILLVAAVSVPVTADRGIHSFTEEYNAEIQRTPPLIATLVADERVNVLIRDGNDLDTRGVAFDGTTIESVRRDGFLNPTLEVKTDRATAERILSAEDRFGALKDAIATGDVKIEGEGIGNALEAALVTRLVRVQARVADFGSDRFEVAEGERTRIEYAGSEVVLERDSAGRRIVRHPDYEMFLTVDEHGAPTGFSTTGTQKLLADDRGDFPDDAGIYHVDFLGSPILYGIGVNPPGGFGGSLPDSGASGRHTPPTDTGDTTTGDDEPPEDVEGCEIRDMGFVAIEDRTAYHATVEALTTSIQIYPTVFKTRKEFGDHWYESYSSPYANIDNTGSMAGFGTTTLTIRLTDDGWTDYDAYHRTEASGATSLQLSSNIRYNVYGFVETRGSGTVTVTETVTGHIAGKISPTGAIAGGSIAYYAEGYNDDRVMDGVIHHRFGRQSDIGDDDPNFRRETYGISIDCDRKNTHVWDAGVVNLGTGYNDKSSVSYTSDFTVTYHLD